MTPEYVTPKVAASTLGLDLATIYRQIKAGNLPCIKVGNSIRVKLREIPVKGLQHD